ncbi:MAG: hypothetical protein MUF23_09360 [Pirellula sp.]|jgi:hypothetical protein|nr:hypothetical protein [Pirellula sp.]
MASPYFQFLLVGLATVGVGPAASADVIELRDGGVIVGKVLNPQGGQTVRIETDDGTIIELDRKLTKIHASMERELEYIDKAKARGDSLEDHKALVEACVNEGLQTLANAHRERIVELDPSDRQSWDLLKYFKDEASGKWLRREVVMYRRGKVKGDKGRWYTWQEKALMDLDRKYTEQRVAAEKELQQRLKGLTGNAKQQSEAQAYFQNLNNPLVITKLLKLFREDRSQDRSFYFQLLQQMPPQAVAPAIISIALEDADMTFVNSALDYLESSDELVQEMALASFAARLKDKKKRERAAYCMAPIADERFIGMLIDSLLSTDLVVPAGPPGALNAGVGRDGGVGFSSGGQQPQQRVNQHKNVLATLTQLTGQNFGFDVQAWRVWFAQTYAYENLDLRRDEY